MDVGGEVDLAAQDRLERCFGTVSHDLAMDPAGAFQDAEDRGLLPGAAPWPAADAGRAEIAFIDFDLASEGAAFAGELGHAEAQKGEDRGRRLVVKAGERRRPVGGDVEREEAGEIAEFPLRESPPKQVGVFLSHLSTLT